MSSVFSKPKSPKPPAPSPMPETGNEEAGQAAAFEAMRRRRRASRSNTILTDRGTSLLGS